MSGAFDGGGDAPPPGTATPTAGGSADDDYVFPSGCLTMSVLCFLFGLALLLPMAVLPNLNAWQARSWEPMTCRLEQVGVDTTDDYEGTYYGMEATFTYEVAGRTYTGDRYDFAIGRYGEQGEELARDARRHRAGDLTTCWVNPEDPEDAVVERRAGVPPIASLMALPPFLVGLLGFWIVAYGLYHHWRDQRRARRRGRDPYDLDRYRKGRDEWDRYD